MQQKKKRQSQRPSPRRASKAKRSKPKDNPIKAFVRATIDDVNGLAFAAAQRDAVSALRNLEARFTTPGPEKRCDGLAPIILRLNLVLSRLGFDCAPITILREHTKDGDTSRTAECWEVALWGEGISTVVRTIPARGYVDRADEDSVAAAGVPMTDDNLGFILSAIRTWCNAVEGVSSSGFAGSMIEPDDDWIARASLALIDDVIQVQHAHEVMSPRRTDEESAGWTRSDFSEKIECDTRTPARWAEKLDIPRPDGPNDAFTLEQTIQILTFASRNARRHEWKRKVKDELANLRAQQ